MDYLSECEVRTQSFSRGGSLVDSPTENSPSGLWRTLGKRVGLTPSGVRIPYSPPAFARLTNPPRVLLYYDSPMSEKEVLAYINAQSEPKRTTLLEVRKSILEIEPDLEQVIAWKAPMFKLRGKYIAGLCAFKTHLTFSPQSAAVMEANSEALKEYVTSKNSFQFAMDAPLPKPLLAKLIKDRIQELP